MTPYAMYVVHFAMGRQANLNIPVDSARDPLEAITLAKKDEHYHEMRPLISGIPVAEYVRQVEGAIPCH